MQGGRKFVRLFGVNLRGVEVILEVFNKSFICKFTVDFQISIFVICTLLNKLPVKGISLKVLLNMLIIRLDLNPTVMSLKNNIFKSKRVQTCV